MPQDTAWVHTRVAAYQPVDLMARVLRSPGRLPADPRPPGTAAAAGRPFGVVVRLAVRVREGPGRAAARTLDHLPRLGDLAGRLLIAHPRQDGMGDSVR